MNNDTIAIRRATVIDDAERILLDNLCAVLQNSIVLLNHRLRLLNSIAGRNSNEDSPRLHDMPERALAVAFVLGMQKEFNDYPPEWSESAVANALSRCEFAYDAEQLVCSLRERVGATLADVWRRA